MDENKEIIEVIDSNGDSLSKPRSAIEKVTKVDGYNDLVFKIEALGIVDDMDYGDGKTYSPVVGRIVWRTVILATKPIQPSSQADRDSLISIYKIIYAFTQSGEYPLLQQLCNYLGLNMDDFFTIIRTNGHPNKDVYLWAYNVFEAAASMNAIRSNGNANMRIWLDKSREYKISTETRLELSMEINKRKVLEGNGRDIAMLLMREGNEDEE